MSGGGDGGLEPFVPPEDEYEDVDPPEGARDANAADDTPDAVSPRNQARQRNKRKLEQQNLADFWKRTLGDPVGRRAMWGILDSLKTFETRFACSPAGFPCPEATWFQAGEQATGQRLYHSFMKFDLEGTWLMLKEHHPDFVPPRKPPRSTPP